MPTIDLAFRLVGTEIPLDHGYSLFSALSRIVPHLHEDRGVGVHPIRGRQTGPGLLSLFEASRLRIRLASERVAEFLSVAGSILDVGGHRLVVGIPSVESLNASASLASRLVTFKNALDPSAFQEDVRRELDHLEIAGTPSLVTATRKGWEGQPIRRVMKVKDRRIIGFALHVTGLTAEESLKLQEEGLGGRRRFGCGVFVPFNQRAPLSGLGPTSSL